MNQVSIFFSCVFLTLAVSWIVDLSFIFPRPRQRPVPVKRNRRIY